jgi:hypothetical protein
MIYFVSHRDGLHPRARWPVVLALLSFIEAMDQDVLPTADCEFFRVVDIGHTYQFMTPAKSAQEKYKVPC